MTAIVPGASPSGRTPLLVSTATAWAAARRASVRSSAVSKAAGRGVGLDVGVLEKAECDLLAQDATERPIDDGDVELALFDLFDEGGEAVA